MTLYLIAERILRLYAGGTPTVDSGIKIGDVKHMVVDVINRLLKIETITMPDNQGHPTNLMLATYENISVDLDSNGETSSITLPAYPISLPLNAGVWQVAPHRSSLSVHAEFIPLQFGQFALIKDFSPLVVDGRILGNRTYEVMGNKLRFPVNIRPYTENITVRLVVSDIATLGDFDLLPLPTDYVNEVIIETLKLLGVVPPVEDVTNDGNKQK